MVLAVALVYLLLADQFPKLDRSGNRAAWLCRFRSCGVIWMLYITHTHISVPALMGTLMCIGLTTANSTLVVAFANDRLKARATMAAHCRHHQPAGRASARC